MGPLHEAFERAVSGGAIAALVTELLCNKLKQQGIQLSRRHKRILNARVAAADFGHIKLPSWKWWLTRDIRLEFTGSDLEDLDRSAQRWMERLPEIIESVSDELAGDILGRLRRDWAGQARYQRRMAKGFRKRLDRRWRVPFNRLEMLLTIAAELGDGVNSRQRVERPAHPHKVEVLTRLHARACQIGAEVIALLRNGFADGAMARWRTLHEVAVVLLFISEGDDELAERYLLHQVVESRRAADEYQSYCDRIGYERMQVAETQTIKDEFERLVDRFGAEFREPYGWAAQRLRLKSPRFVDIEQAVDVDHLRPFYRMASHNVHANPKGVFFKLGLVDEADILLTGPSNMGLADPGGSTANSIVQATSGLSALDTTLDVIVALKIMMTLSTEVAESFAATQNEIESEVA